MQANKKFIGFLAFCFIYLGFHAEGQLPFPGKGQVVLVGKVSISCTFDEFYAKTFKDGNADNPHLVSISLAENSCGIVKGHSGGGNGGEFFFIPFDRRSRIAIRIKGFKYLPFSIEEAYVLLPFWKEFTLPLEGQFFYIGSLVYDFDLKKVEVTSVDSVDEYDAAQIAVNKAFNAEIPLRRVPLNDLAEY